MSQLARMFVVLNFLLAAGFLYSAAMFLGLNHEYKKKNEGLTVQLAQEKADSAKREAAQKTRIDDLTRESQTAKEKATNLEGSEGRLREQNNVAEADKKTKDASIAKEQGNVATANDNLKRANEELSKRTDEANKLRADMATAQAAERKANDELEKAKTEIRTRDNSIADLEKAKTDLTAKVDELEIVKKIALDNNVDITNILSKAPIADAKVIGVDMSMKLVQVNAGITQKVARGSMLDIVRGGTYIGRIKIDQVYPNSSAGTLFVAAPGQEPQVGDRATNTIN